MKHYVFWMSLSMILLLTKCSTTDITVTKINDTTSIQSPGLIYSIPETVLRLTCTITKTNIKKGPFAPYAQKYLGLDNVPKADETRYQIKNLRVNNAIQADVDHYYHLTSDQTLACLRNQVLEKTSGGWLLNFPKAPYRNYNEGNSYLSSSRQPPADQQILLSEQRTLKRDTLYKTVMKDSVYVKVPVYRKKWVKKDQKKKAEELANMLQKLEKRKIELVAQLDEYETSSGGLQTALEEMRTIQKEYKKLFVGQRKTREKKYAFRYTPSNQSPKDTVTLFRFSSQQGIIPENRSQGAPVKLIIHPREKMKAPDLETTGKTGNNSLLYRIPVVSEIQIRYKNQLLFETETLIYQYGPLVPVMYKYLCSD